MHITSKFILYLGAGFIFEMHEPIALSIRDEKHTHRLQIEFQAAQEAGPDFLMQMAYQTHLIYKKP